MSSGSTRMDSKRSRGEYYTEGNPFSLNPFLEWSERVDLVNRVILEPFAGANDIIKSLQEIDLCGDFDSYDIHPCDQFVRYRDTVSDFPSGYEVCVTNPPWLARNSATRRGLAYPATAYDDLYKHCLDLCLANCPFVAALIPASYLHSGLFRDRLETYVLLHDRNMFNNTDNPVCLALFGEHSSTNVSIFYDDEYVGSLASLHKKVPVPVRDRGVRFNDPGGKLGFIAFDNTTEPSIRFCPAKEIENYPVKVSSRFFSRISVSKYDFSIDNLNASLDSFRVETRDLFLTPFKGIRKDGWYRRRMSFALAKTIINAS